MSGRMYNDDLDYPGPEDFAEDSGTRRRSVVQNIQRRTPLPADSNVGMHTPSFHRSSLNQTTPLSRNGNQYTAPPHRVVTSSLTSNSPMPTTSYKGYRIMNDQIVMFRHEIDFLVSVDETKPFLENLCETVHEDVLDIGKCGLVVLKYKTTGKFDEDVYNFCAKKMSTFHLKTLSTGSSLGRMSLEVSNLGQMFYLKTLSERHESLSKKERTPVPKGFQLKFTHVIRTFNGTWPFKTHQYVSTQSIGSVSNDTRRAVSTILKHILAQILEDPRGHQSFALRINHGKSGKNEKLKNLPRDVTEFLREFCLISFDFPARSRFPSYTYDDLMRENASLGARLGRTREEGIAHFCQFQKDVQQFIDVVNEKIQRVLYDLRSTILKDVVHDHNGEQATMREFITENRAQKQKKRKYPDGNERSEANTDHLNQSESNTRREEHEHTPSDGESNHPHRY